MMKIKYYIISLVITIFTFTNAIAELPYESDHEHSFVLTGGMKEKDPFTDKFQKVFSFNYIYQNKISFGISYRDNSTRNQFQYDAITRAAIEQSGDSLTLFNRNSYTTVYTQIKPLNILKIKAPVSFSLLVAMQDVSDDRNFVANGYIYKKFTLNQKHSIQPILSIGYREISSSSSANISSIAASMIYSLSIHKNTDILIIPRVNDFSGVVNYSVQVGISYGL